MRKPSRLLTALAVLGLLLLGGTAPAEAEGHNLDGRMAPDMSFSAGFNGTGAGTKLSAFRGRAVYVKFWLRDCPVCRRSLPQVQRLHERWGKRGLTVLTVVHKFGPKDVAPVMRKLGYSFPVVSDFDGSQARRYGVKRRPADYLIGVDGRVKASNNVSEQAIATELGKYRLRRIDPMPAGLKSAREAVWTSNLGQALRLSEAAAQAKGAAQDLVAAAGRVRALASEDLEGAAAWAGTLAAKRQTAAADRELARLRKEYAGTSLATRVAQLVAAHRKRHGGG